MNHAEPATVFLVDDDKFFLKSLEHHLLHTLNTNVHISSYQNGEECLQHMNDETGIIVLDYFLNAGNPKAMNGIEALRQIRSLYPKTKVIILSGQENIEVAIEALKFGASDYVVKNEKAFSKIHDLVRALQLNKQKKISSRPKLVWIAALITLGLLLLFLLENYRK
ncbi:MAG: response regulator [Bacteroidia bacterium]